MKYLSFSAGLILFNIMSPRSIHVVVDDKNSSILWLSDISLCIWPFFFIFTFDNLYLVDHGGKGQGSKESGRDHC